MAREENKYKQTNELRVKHTVPRKKYNGESASRGGACFFDRCLNRVQDRSLRRAGVSQTFWGEKGFRT